MASRRGATTRGRKSGQGAWMRSLRGTTVRECGRRQPPSPRPALSGPGVCDVLIVTDKRTPGHLGRPGVAIFFTLVEEMRLRRRTC